MKNSSTRFLAVTVLLSLALFRGLPASAGEPAEKIFLNEHLEALRPLLGKTWKGHFKNATPEKSQIDVMRYERALNGHGVRVIHSINDGVYGGESMILWDKEKQALVYYYFTTAGFYTSGTMTIKGGRFISHEMVTGNSEGVTEVKATSELRSDGSIHTQSQYLKKNEWVPGHEVTYREDPKAKVVFK